jgi:type II secretory pathway pseudopilin PulG
MLKRDLPSSVIGRPAFTLVEMLVVIIIIMLLATLVVALGPKIAGEQKVAKGADQLQGWLLIAKSRAKRDQIPTGVRLIPDPNNPYHVRELQYIQQPDDFTGGKVRVVGNRVIAQPDPQTGQLSVDFSGGFTQIAAAPVQPEDYFEVKGGGTVHRIHRASDRALILYTSHPYNIAEPTGDYRVIRRPRALVGETPMLLAQDIAIDISTNSFPGYGSMQLPVPNSDGSIDIMFSPAGSLLTTSSGNSSFLPLWIRDVTVDVPDPVNAPGMGGGPIIVCIYKRAGFIAAHPVDITPGPPYKPYSFATDGKSSGI